MCRVCFLVEVRQVREEQDQSKLGAWLTCPKTVLRTCFFASDLPCKVPEKILGACRPGSCFRKASDWQWLSFACQKLLAGSNMGNVMGVKKHLGSIQRDSGTALVSRWSTGRFSCTSRPGKQTTTRKMMTCQTMSLTIRLADCMQQQGGIRRDSGTLNELGKSVSVLLGTASQLKPC